MKTIGIEALLAWAYRDELPKAVDATPMGGALGFGAGWDSVSRQGELMADCVSDGRPNAYGVLPLAAWYGAPPHADALAVHEAVLRLAACEVEVPDGWSPLVGLGLSEQEQREAIARAAPRVFRQGLDGGRRFAFDVRELVRRYAILGGCPDWRVAPPKRRLVEVCGQPAWFRVVRQRSVMFGDLRAVEIDGFDARRQRPFPDAYRKTVLTPDPALAVVDRAEYESWAAALDWLARDLSAAGALGAHVVAASDRSLRPWEL